VEFIAQRLRTPEERVGKLPNVSLPPPRQNIELASEEELLARGLRAGDERALASVLDRLFPPMLRLAESYVGNRASAEETVQETWLAALRGIDRFEGRSSLKTWLFRILKNVARTRGKRDARMKPFSDMTLQVTLESGDLLDTLGPEAPQPLWSNTTDPETELLSAELAAHIERAIATLPERQREVLVLRDVEGWSSEDVCNVLGISQTNQRVILHRARNRVRDDLQVYLADADCEEREIVF
jgi:RNA polymerase sigma-70 factor (ECF subfamily)